MARKRRLEGVESRRGSGGATRYRGTAYVLGEQLKGPWSTDQDEAVAWRERALADARVGRGTVECMTIGDAIKVFVAGMKDGSIRNRSGRVYKPSVIVGYEHHLAICAVAVGWSTRLDRIHLPQAQVLLDELRRLGHSDSWTRNAISSFRALYNWAIPRGYAAANPCVGLQVPVTDEKRRERIATLAEVRLLCGALPLPERTAFTLAAYAGLRAGEIIGLEWGDIEMERPALRVERAVDTNTGLIIAPKSRAAHRTVPICDPLLSVLQDHQDTLGAAGPLFPAQKARRGREVSPGARLAYTGLRRRMTRAWVAAGLEPLGLHEARHTFASMLIDAGASAKAIQTYMGHSSITVTFDRYGHLMPGNEAEVLKLINAYHETGVAA